MAIVSMDGNLQLSSVMVTYKLRIMGNQFTLIPKTSRSAEHRTSFLRVCCGVE